MTWVLHIAEIVSMIAIWWRIVEHAKAIRHLIWRHNVHVGRTDKLEGIEGRMESNHRWTVSRFNDIFTKVIAIEGKLK